MLFEFPILVCFLNSEVSEDPAILSDLPNDLRRTHDFKQKLPIVVLYLLNLEAIEKRNKNIADVVVAVVVHGFVDDVVLVFLQLKAEIVLNVHVFVLVLLELQEEGYPAPLLDN